MIAAIAAAEKGYLSKTLSLPRAGITAQDKPGMKVSVLMTGEKRSG